MTTQSGFKFSLTGFLPADPNDGTAVAEAVALLDKIIVSAVEAGLVDLCADKRYVTRRRTDDIDIPPTPEQTPEPAKGGGA